MLSAAKAVAVGLLLAPLLLLLNYLLHQNYRYCSSGPEMTTYPKKVTLAYTSEKTQRRLLEQVQEPLRNLNCRPLMFLYS
jgi:hypothetical protein